ncbi:MAG TPA: sigma-70 family RNA polymerase sigma factor [Gemmata sp.]
MPTRHADRLMPTLRRVVLGRQSAARTDGELLTAFVLTGEGDAFGELVRRHGPMVLGVCRRLIPDHATAEDAFQAAFLVLARRAASVRPREQVGNYLYGVAYRTALKARTVLARRRSREKQVDAMPEPTAPGAAPVWSDVQPVLDEELARLPEKLRVAVVLCDLEGRSQREVARHLNVPPATLATRLASARRTLAARLTRRGVTLSGGALAGLMGIHASASAVPYPLSMGAVRAAEALAAGGSVNALVSAQAVQLSEGVMQMMMLAKLKAVAVVTALVLTLGSGLGVGLVPAAAGEPGTAEGAGATTARVNGSKPVPPADRIGGAIAARVKDRYATEPDVDDATFLRRLSLDVRGTLPTPVETWFFVSDDDREKRAKVIEWVADNDATRAAIAKKLGVPIERVRIVRARVTPSADGRSVTVVDELNTEATLLDKTTFLRVLDEKHLANISPADIVVRGNVIQKAAPVPAAQPSAPEEGKRDVAVWESLLVGEKSDTLIRREGVNGKVTYRVVNGKDGNDAQQQVDVVVTYAVDSDAEFLKRVLTDVRGSGPTTLELKYFTDDKDPKKREKLLDALLKEPGVQKKLGDEWKKKMLAFGAAQGTAQLNFLYLLDGKDKRLLNLKAQPGAKPVVVPLPPAPPKPPVPPKPPTAPAPQSDKLEKLVGELLAAKKSDEALLEAVTLATLSRLPTDAEKALTLAAVGSASDRKAAWVAVARALTGSGTKKVNEIQLRVVPVPPAKP